MSITDKSFSPEEIILLKKMKGRILQTVDAVIIARGDMSWQTVRLHFDGLHVDIINTLGEIEVDELGTIDEFGLLSVCEASSDLLDIPEASADTTTMSIYLPVIGVDIAIDVIDVSGNGNLVASIVYPQAIALQFPDYVLVLDKENWFSEMIAVKQGVDMDTLLYDESVNWEDNPEEDPTTHYDFNIKRISL